MAYRSSCVLISDGGNLLASQFASSTAIARSFGSVNDRIGMICLGGVPSKIADRVKSSKGNYASLIEFAYFHGWDG